MNFSLCVLLQDDQSVPWPSMEDQTEHTHVCTKYRMDNNFDLRKTHHKKNNERSQHSWDNNPTKT